MDQDTCSFWLKPSVHSSFPNVSEIHKYSVTLKGELTDESTKSQSDALALEGGRESRSIAWRGWEGGGLLRAGCDYDLDVGLIFFFSLSCWKHSLDSSLIADRLHLFSETSPLPIVQLITGPADLCENKHTHIRAQTCAHTAGQRLIPILLLLLLKILYIFLTTVSQNNTFQSYKKKTYKIYSILTMLQLV